MEIYIILFLTEIIAIIDLKFQRAYNNLGMFSQCNCNYTLFHSILDLFSTALLL